jgi:putative membrane protein
MSPRRNVAAGLAAGAVSGLAASWLMLRFIQGPGFRLQESLKSDAERRADRAGARHRAATGTPEPETVTMQAADVFASHAPGGRHLSREEKEQGGTVVHYAFGALMGAAYGVASEFTSLPGLGLGTVFGTVLWLNTDLWSVPAVGFSKWPGEEPAGAHVSHWLAHLVYGTGMEATRRLLRR